MDFSNFLDTALIKIEWRFHNRFISLSKSTDIFNVNFILMKFKIYRLDYKCLSNVIYSEDKQQFVGEYVKQVDINKF